MHRPVQQLAEYRHVWVVVERDGSRGWEAEDAHLWLKKRKFSKTKSLSSHAEESDHDLGCPRNDTHNSWKGDEIRPWPARKASKKDE